MSVLSVDNQQQVEKYLLENNFLDQDELVQVKQDATNKKEPFLKYIVTSNIIDEEELTKVTAHINKLPYVDLNDVTVDPKVLELLPRQIAERYMAVPLGEMKGRLVLAMLEAGNVQAVDFLATKIGRPLTVYQASEKAIREVLAQYGTSELDEKLTAVFKDDVEAAEQQAAQAKKVKTITEDSPITKALNSILEYAAQNRASDIHIEPLEDSLKIRARVDGILREIMQLPKVTEPALISRIKILSDMKIDEHRVPQDGEFTFLFREREIDLRIAVSPVVWGEQVVIRLLDKTGTSLKLEDLGFRGHALETVRKGIRKPHGMILNSGPTGSGKSTSLYALLQEIKDDTINIVTLEDPVEYKMPGVNQIQINTEVGLTFASGLRSILRQDPDVVMVGEIRDGETATLAIQAALTGHLVFSTLHTNSAAGVLPRLLDMGVEPFLIASTVNTVIGQRLVRRLSDNKEEYESSDAQTDGIKSTLGKILPSNEKEKSKVQKKLGYDDLPLADQNAYTLYKGSESSKTPGGYKGRMGLYEVIDVNEEIEKLIIKQTTSNDIQKHAMAQGTVTMRQDGYLKALNGETTLDEVNRVAALDSA